MKRHPGQVGDHPECRTSVPFSGAIRMHHPPCTSIYSSTSKIVSCILLTFHYVDMLELLVMGWNSNSSLLLPPRDYLAQSPKSQGWSFQDGWSTAYIIHQQKLRWGQGPPWITKDHSGNSEDLGFRLRTRDKDGENYCTTHGIRVWQDLTPANLPRLTSASLTALQTQSPAWGSLNTPCCFRTWNSAHTIFSTYIRFLLCLASELLLIGQDLSKLLHLCGALPGRVNPHLCSAASIPCLFIDYLCPLSRRLYVLLACNVVTAEWRFHDLSILFEVIFVFLEGALLPCHFCLLTLHAPAQEIQDVPVVHRYKRPSWLLVNELALKVSWLTIPAQPFVFWKEHG